MADAEGLHYVYIGNVPGHPAENTYCPKCRRLLVERVGLTTRPDVDSQRQLPILPAADSGHMARMSEEESVMRTQSAYLVGRAALLLAMLAVVHAAMFPRAASPRTTSDSQRLPAASIRPIRKALSAMIDEMLARASVPEITDRFWPWWLRTLATSIPARWRLTPMPRSRDESFPAWW